MHQKKGLLSGFHLNDRTLCLRILAFHHRRPKPTLRRKGVLYLTFMFFRARPNSNPLCFSSSPRRKLALPQKASFFPLRTGPFVDRTERKRRFIPGLELKNHSGVVYSVHCTEGYRSIRPPRYKTSRHFRVSWILRILIPFDTAFNTIVPI